MSNDSRSIAALNYGVVRSNRPPSGRSIRFLLVLLITTAGVNGCFFGGLVVKGGQSYAVQWQSEAAIMNAVAFDYICQNTVTSASPETESGNAGPAAEQVDAKVQPFRYISPAEYQNDCPVESQSSVFFLFNMLPVTPPLDVDYALSRAIQMREGDNVIDMQAWHEVHYYGIIGRVFVYRLRGHVIRYRKQG
ncbi:MAG: hypothetical protein KDK39_16685 [Leptospiraceae bacterium]|nr:hypothetical protein [Leptospiraceae bacterium]